MNTKWTEGSCPHRAVVQRTEKINTLNREKEHVCKSRKSVLRGKAKKESWGDMKRATKYNSVQYYVQIDVMTWPIYANI
jgi:hypothetical protein